MTAPARPANPADLLRNRRYLALLVLSAALGVVVSFAAYWFLKAIAEVNAWTFTDLPHGLSLDPVPTWWPIVPLGVAGLAVGFIVRAAPGGGGEVPIEGFKPGGVTPPGHLLGIALAALASIGLGAVVGPEGPLIALGGGLAYLLIWIRNRDVPAQTGLMVAATGSFAAVSTLLGSPILGAILLLEASGLGGVTASVALVPGLLGAGIGSLVFVGLDAWTGFGTFSLTVPNLAAVGRPTVAGIAWAVAVGLAGAALCQVIHLLARRLLALVERRVVLITALVGLATGALAILYNQRTGHSAADVLFSGQAALPGVIQNSASYSVGALLLLILCKGLAYIGGLSSFRGGPTFPAMFIGAAGGIALSHLPGLAVVPGAAIGVAAMTVAILRLPITTVLLTAVFFGNDGIALTPLIIVAVVVSYVTSVWLDDAVGRRADDGARTTRGG